MPHGAAHIRGVVLASCAAKPCRGKGTPLLAAVVTQQLDRPQALGEKRLAW